MQTFLSEELKQSAEVREADEILRSCVHCGFCNATCPTFQLLVTNATVRAAAYT